MSQETSDTLAQAQGRATVAREILRRMGETPGISDERATAMATIATAHAATAQAFAQIALVEMLQKLVVPPSPSASSSDVPVSDTLAQDTSPDETDV